MTIRQSGTIQRRTIPRSELERWPVRRFKFASVSWTLIYDTGPFNVTIRTVAGKFAVPCFRRTISLQEVFDVTSFFRRRIGCYLLASFLPNCAPNFAGN